MELPIKLVEQIAFNTRSKIEELSRTKAYMKSFYLNHFKQILNKFKQK